MDTGIVILLVFTGIGFLVWKFVRPRFTEPHYTAIREQASTGVVEQGGVNPATLHAIKENTAIISNEKEAIWWKLLDSFCQLQLALVLSKKIVPVWEKYTLAYEPAYRDSPTGPLVKINTGLLHDTIEHITLVSSLQFPDGRSEKIMHFYYNFVGAIIAMQDGTWKPPHPIKKLFSAVYFILKSIVEQDTRPSGESLLSLSIDHSLDCIDMTKIYSNREVALFLEEYKSSMKPKAE